MYSLIAVISNLGIYGVSALLLDNFCFSLSGDFCKGAGFSNVILKNPKSFLESKSSESRAYSGFARMYSSS